MPHLLAAMGLTLELRAVSKGVAIKLKIESKEDPIP